MTDPSKVPTTPPPPNVSADAVYVADTILTKLGELRVQFNAALGDLHAKLENYSADVRTLTQSLAERVLAVHQSVPSLERKVARLRSDVDGLMAEAEAGNGNGSHR